MSTNDAASFPDRGTCVFIVTTITFVIASIFVFARLISRLVIVRSVNLDDYFMFAAWLAAFGLSFAGDFATRRGLGRHDPQIPYNWRPALQRCEYAFAVLYNPSLMLTNTSILVFYLHLSRNTNKLLRIASYMTLALVIVAGIVLTLMNVFQCNPIGGAFDNSKMRDAKCIPLVTLFLCSAPVNIFTDLAVLVLPIPVLTRMRLPRKQKNILVITFGLGIFVIGVDVVRIYFLQHAAAVASKGYLSASSSVSQIGNAPDFAWYASFSLMWSATEVNIGITCACVPTLKPLLIRILPSFSDGNRMSEYADKNGCDGSGGDLAAATEQQEAAFEITNPAEAQERRGSLDGGRGGEACQVGEDPEMGMFDFLTEPGMDLDQVRSRTAQTQIHPNLVYFGFINMRRPRSMLATRGWESAKYCMLVTSLFFLWGFSYGILNTLNMEVVAIKHGTNVRIFGLQTAYFGAYLCGPLILGQYTLRNAGFKVTFMFGLCIYATGTLMFWPSAVLISYPGFVISNFVVGFGLSLLETAANPFLSLCGSPEYCETRLLLAQGIQAVASVLSPLLANKVLFRNVTNTTPNLIKVQWTYLAIAFFDVILALFFYYMPLPEATDEALEMQTLKNSPFTFASHPGRPKHRPQEGHIGHYRTIHITLAFGAASLFLYVAAQECISTLFVGFLETAPSRFESLSLTPLDYLLVAHTAFAVGRFLFALLCLVVRPRILLVICYVGAVVFASLAFAINTSSNATAALLITCFFFEGPIFPLLFSISLRSMGRKTKLAAAILTSGVSGGGLLTWAIYAVYYAGKNTVRYILCVPIAFFAVGTLYPLYLNLFLDAREQVDSRPTEEWMSHRSGSEAHQGEKEPVIRRLSNKVIFTLSKVTGRRTSATEMAVEPKDARGDSVGHGSTATSQ